MAHYGRDFMGRMRHAWDRLTDRVEDRVPGWMGGGGRGYDRGYDRGHGGGMRRGGYDRMDYRDRGWDDLSDSGFGANTGGRMLRGWAGGPGSMRGMERALGRHPGMGRGRPERYGTPGGRDYDHSDYRNWSPQSAGGRGYDRGFGPFPRNRGR